MSTTKSIAQTVALCIGLIVATVVWSDDCAEGVKARNATNPDAAQSQTQALSASDQYKMFHDARLNESDGLGDYVQNFQAD